MGRCTDWVCVPAMNVGHVSSVGRGGGCCTTAANYRGRMKPHQNKTCPRHDKEPRQNRDVSRCQTCCVTLLRVQLHQRGVCGVGGGSFPPCPPDFLGVSCLRMLAAGSFVIVLRFGTSAGELQHLGQDGACDWRSTWTESLRFSLFQTRGGCS